MEEQLHSLVDDGLTVAEIANRMGLSKIGVMRLAGATGVLPKLMGRGDSRSEPVVGRRGRDEAKDERIRELVASGMRPKQIAIEMGISRERVRQRIARAKIELPPRPRRVRMSKKYGIPMEEANRLRSIGAMAAFIRQRQNARTRGIEWQMTFNEWWGVWEASGRWEQRGRDTGGWVMGRFGDVGPYAVGNVVICDHSENARVRSSHADPSRNLQKR